jgi:hypothetical protein
MNFIVRNLPLSSNSGDGKREYALVVVRKLRGNMCKVATFCVAVEFEVNDWDRE